MNYFVYAVAVLLAIAVALFVKATVFSKRPQKSGLVLIALAVPLFMIYYNDRWPAAWGHLRMRELVTPLKQLDGADINFRSDVVPALMIAGILLVHMAVFQRVAVRERLQRVADPIANFFASAVAATLVGATLVSTFHWGWVGAIVVGLIFTLVYLGIVALLAALLEVVVELLKLFAVWLKRKVFALATMITRASSWVSSLSGRLGLRSFADRIRAENAEQETIFQDEQESQDKALYEAYLRDRARRRRMLQGGALPPDPDDARPALAVPAPSTPAAPIPAAPIPADPIPAAPIPADPIPAASVPADPIPAASVPAGPAASTPAASGPGAPAA